ncbi:MAG: T9SS type A sorting domain-containing protein [Candidatus Kapabacteria bacterium]|jgi:hypothetical protein|nr:T9SS type A sorting domain-containing protein [Candidatus Kapabacteria bacterium]
MKNLLILAAAFLMLTVITNAQTKNENQLQRFPKGVFDLQSNTKSNFEFKTTNYGIFGFDVSAGVSGGIWPRGSQNQYIFAGGFWFGAKKYRKVYNDNVNIVSISYNPNTGKGWFVPGRIEDADSLRDDLINKYRIYFSTDFDQYTGQPLISEDGPNWPFWITDKDKKYHYGTYVNEYVHNETLRNRENKPFGPLFVSDEDIVSTFKDTDLNFYEGGYQIRKERGYPLRVQVESSIYSWGEGDMHDIIIQSYVLENKSEDTYTDCWFTPVYDVDIALKSSGPFGASNDKMKFYECDTLLNLAVGWTNRDRGEEGKGFGYVGFSLLETPAVDEQKNIRTDKLIYEPSEQLGMVTFRNWNIEFDPKEDNERYDFMSSKIRDGDTGPGDKRMMFATGPFNMKPGDKARIAVSIAFAMPAKGGEADGTCEDIAGFVEKTNKDDSPDAQSTGKSLIDKIKRSYSNYYNGTVMSVRANEPNQFDASVYPNPSGNEATIDYTIKTAGQLRISILDNLGKEISQVFSGYRNEGNYHHFIELSKLNLTDGVYYIKLENNNNFAVKKLLIVK